MYLHETSDGSVVLSDPLISPRCIPSGKEEGPRTGLFAGQNRTVSFVPCTACLHGREAHLYHAMHSFCTDIPDIFHRHLGRQGRQWAVAGGVSGMDAVVPFLFFKQAGQNIDFGTGTGRDSYFTRTLSLPL